MSYLGFSLLSLFFGFASIHSPTIPVTDVTYIESSENNDTYQFSSYGTQISIPKIYSIQKNTFESLRRGAETSYDLTYLTSSSKDFYITEIQFFTQDSVQRFNEKCDVAKEFCFEGYAPTVEDFANLKKSLTSNVEFKSSYYETLRIAKMNLNQTPAIRITEKCTGDVCMVIEYYYLSGDAIISVNVIAYNSPLELEEIEQKADEVAKEVYFE